MLHATVNWLKELWVLLDRMSNPAFKGANQSTILKDRGEWIKLLTFVTKHSVDNNMLLERNGICAFVVKKRPQIEAIHLKYIQIHTLEIMRT